MKMYSNSQEMDEFGCREEVVQGTDTRGSVLFKALSRDGGNINIDSRSNPLLNPNDSFVRNCYSLQHEDDARLAEKPMLMSLLKPSNQDTTVAPSGAALAAGRRGEAVGVRRHHRRHESSIGTGSSLHHDSASGHYQKRRLQQISHMGGRIKSPSNGGYATFTAVPDSSSNSLSKGPIVITLPAPTKGTVLASPSRSRHRSKASGPEVVLDDGSTWSGHSKRTRESVTSSVHEGFQPGVRHQQRQEASVYQLPEPGCIFKGPREQFDHQQSRVLVINGSGNEPNSYVLPDTPPHSLPPVVSSSSLSIHPVYTNSPDSVEMGLEHEQCSEQLEHLAGRSDMQSARRLHRSVSNESCSTDSSGSNTPWDDTCTQDHESSYQSNTGVEDVKPLSFPNIHVAVMENAPLDLSMGRRVDVKGGYVESPQPEDGYDAPVALVVDEPAPAYLQSISEPPSNEPPSSEPPSLLMQLADACTFVLEKETLGSKSCESSPPPSSLSDSNSCHSVYQERLQLQSENTYYTTSQEFFTESQENSMDNCVSLQVQELPDIKCEIGNNFHPGGIILNSNVLGDRVFHDTTAFELQQIDVCSDDKGVLREVANLTVEDGYGDGLYRNVYASEGNSPATPNVEDYHYYRGSQDSSSGSECSSITGRSSSASHHANGGMPTSVICTAGGGDNKKRLRLGKAEYESMSEQDRKIRHRVLDNQRSKQYRERRRRMITKLQCDITNAESNNRALREKYEFYEKRLNIVKEAIVRFRRASNSSVVINTPHFVEAQC